MMSVVRRDVIDAECNNRPKKGKYEYLGKRRRLSSKYVTGQWEQEKEIISRKHGKRPRGQPQKIVELVPAELSCSVSSPDDDVNAKKVKPDCNMCEPHSVLQKEAQTVVAREKQVNKKCGRKALPSELKARKLLKTPSKALPRQLKSALSPGASQASAGSQNGRQTTKKSKELPVELRDKIVERHMSGEGYKKISKSMNISSSTIRSIILKWKVHCTTETLPRSGCPSKLSDQARNRLIIEATVRPTVTLKELKSSIAEMGENVSEATISRSLHKAGLYCKVARETTRTVMAREKPVKKKHGRKVLPLDLRARKLVMTPSKALPRQPKPALGQGASQASTGSPNGRQTTKKSKELPVELRDKIVEKHMSGEGYKKISKSLNLSSSTIRAIILKWKVHHTTETLPRSGCPSKLSDQARSRLISEATVRPTVTLKELKSSIAEMGENVSEATIYRSLHKAGLYCKVAKETTRTVVAREKPVKKKHGRKVLPPDLRARKLLITPSKSLPRQPKPALGQGVSQASTGSPNGRQATKKSKELPVELRDKIVERHMSGEGYKKISKSLNISSSTIRSIILKWKVHRTTETLPRSGCPSKLSDQARNRLISEATVRPTVTLKELKSSVAEMGENVSEATISRSLQKAGLYCKVVKKNVQTKGRCLMQSQQGVIPSTPSLL